VEGHFPPDLKTAPGLNIKEEMAAVMVESEQLEIRFFIGG
jgi:hypothetical protein